MYPILFKLGPLTIFSYGFMVAIGFLIGIFLALYFARQTGIKSETILDLALYVIVAAIVGARVLYVIGEWPTYLANPIDIIMVQKGGLAFLGGLILTIGVVIFYAHWKKLNLLILLDTITPGTVLGYAIARLGCFFNGCCFGHPTDSILGVKFPPGSLAYFQYPGTLTHPTQLYSVVAMAITFLFLFWLWPRRQFNGQIFFIALAVYSVYRFVIEYFRFCPDELYWLGLNPGQFISLGLLAIGITGLVLLKKKNGGGEI